MKRYCIKSRAGKIEYFDIIAEDDEGFQVKITRISDGHEKVTETHMSHHLFNTCEKSGYIFEMDTKASSASSEKVA